MKSSAIATKPGASAGVMHEARAEPDSAHPPTRILIAGGSGRRVQAIRPDLALCPTIRAHLRLGPRPGTAIRLSADNGVVTVAGGWTVKTESRGWSTS